MAKSQDNISTTDPHPDLLAAVVLHVLVSEGRDGLTVEQIARACERNPGEESQRREVQTALEILVRDHLAIPQTGDGSAFEPTRAAVRADELSF